MVVIDQYVFADSARWSRITCRCEAPQEAKTVIPGRQIRRRKNQVTDGLKNTTSFFSKMIRIDKMLNDLSGDQQIISVIRHGTLPAVGIPIETFEPLGPDSVQRALTDIESMQCFDSGSCIHRRSHAA